MSLKFLKFINDFRNGEYPFKVLYQFDGLAVPVHFDDTVISILENKNLKTDEDIISWLNDFLEKGNFEKYLRNKKEIKERLNNQNIVFTDIQMHTSHSPNTKSFQRGVERSIKNKKPGRYYFKVKDLKILEENNEYAKISFTIPINNKEKYNLIIPKDMPLCLGKDAMEKIK